MKKLKEISIQLDRDFMKKHQINPKIDIDIVLKKKEIKLEKTRKKKLEDYLALFDEGLKSILKIHELCKEHYFDKKVGMSFLVLSSKAASLLIGIRKMIFSGLADCEKNLNRTLLETFDIFFACIIDDELNNSFSHTDKMYDNNEFYWKNFSKNKLEKQVNKLFDELKLEEDFILFFNQKRKNLKSFFSESIHSSFNSAFVNHIMITLDFEIDDDCTGKLTTAFPTMLVSLSQEIYIFNEIFRLAIDKNLIKDLLDIHKREGFQLYDYYYNKFSLLYRNNIQELETDAKSYLDFIKNVEEALHKE